MAIRNLFLCGSIDLSVISPNLKASDLAPEIAKHARTGRNGHVYLSVVCSSKKEVSQYGQTHSISCNDRETKRSIFIGDLKDFTKDDANFSQPHNSPQTQAYSQPKAKVQESDIQSDNDLPF